MNAERCRLLLVEILRLTEEHRRAPPPADATAKVDYIQTTKLGPRTSRLFGGNLDGALRKMLARDLRDLERLGLVDLGRPWGDRVTNVKLTADGEAAAIAASDHSSSV